MNSFENKTILSSGAASGMGFLACKRFVEEGGNKRYTRGLCYRGHLRRA